MVTAYFKCLVLMALVCMSICANAQSTSSAITQNPQTTTKSIQVQLSKLESSSGGRLGVFAINTENKHSIQYKAHERFPFCSTSKLMVVGAILKQSQKNTDLLQKNIRYTQKDIDKGSYAPITKQNIKTGMSVSQLCEAAIKYSDNTAMNLLLNILGGPKAITSYARTINDNKFRLDRWEPELNTAIPGDMRDTTAPMAMGKSIQQLVLGDVLDQKQKEQLTTWLKNNTTGNARIRAGVPHEWVVGDKTGTGDYGTTNDIGLIWPPKCAPIVIAIYYTQNKKDATPKDNVIASATRLLINEFAKTDKCLKLKHA